MILLDTNLLTRMTRPLDPQCGIARAAINACRARGDRLVIVPQNLYEFWAVATRPPGPPPAGSNGLGMTTAQAAQWVRFFKRHFSFVPDHDQLSDRWLALVEAHRVTGFRAHDVRLVAAMQCYGINRLLTFNINHFRDLPISILDPASA
ncbi:MAG TPA: type II toxin-antitoxin system VapC family toxin [Tepidisphaeraceae bacterium]|jgi:predicted nucleic acid-binding protein